jgi:hypothetical protein
LLMVHLRLSQSDLESMPSASVMRKPAAVIGPLQRQLHGPQLTLPACLPMNCYRF